MCNTVKVIPILLVFLLVSVSAYAGDLYSSGMELDIFSAAHVDTTGTSDVEQAIGLSPKVSAFYRTAGTDVSNQFYAISTGHVGGNNAYGAASNASNIYQNEFTPGEFTSADLSTNLPDTAVSADSWGTGWSID